MPDTPEHTAPDAHQRDTAAERADIDAAVAGWTLPGVFAALAERAPDAVTMRWPDADGTLAGASVGQQRADVRSASLGLRALGFAPGELGLILAANRYEHAIADLAIVHARGSSVTLYTTSAAEQIAWTIDHCGATVAFVETEEHLARLLSVRDRLPQLRTIITLDADPADADGVLSWADLLELGAVEHGRDPESFAACWQQVQPTDLLSLIYTSGTTGTPKGVMYTHHNALWTAEASGRHWGEEILSGGEVISYLPLAHVSERFTSHWSALWHHLQLGEVGSVAFCPSLEQLVPMMLVVRPTFFVGVPRVWEKLQNAVRSALATQPEESRQAIEQAMIVHRQQSMLRTEGQPVPDALTEQLAAAAPIVAAVRARLGLDRCRIAVTTTAPAPPDLELFWAGLGLPLVEVWGMSELTGPGTAVPPDDIRLGTIGRALPGVQTRLDDDGELQVSSGGVMVGYFRDDVRTADTLTEDGFLRTGDIATDTGGWLRLVDRKKELIITSSGKNVAPVQVESLLKMSPLVGQALVVGDGRNYLTALLVLDADMTAAWAGQHGKPTDPAALVDDPHLREELVAAVRYANSRLARIEQVKRFVVLPQEWTPAGGELTPTQKMRRAVVADRFAEEIAGLYADPPIGIEASPRDPPVGSDG